MHRIIGWTLLASLLLWAIACYPPDTPAPWPEPPYPPPISGAAGAAADGGLAP
jgi:hypothetical protein